MVKNDLEIFRSFFYHFPPEDSLFKRVKGESPKVKGR
jgi:hypothetical protein